MEHPENCFVGVTSEGEEKLGKDKAISAIKEKCKIIFREKDNGKVVNSEKEQLLVKKFTGITYTDLKMDSNNNVSLVDFTPLHLPSMLIKEKQKNAIVSREMLHKKMTTSDKRKFQKGNNCYVDGAIYTNDLAEKNVKVLDYDILGKFDVEFEIVGVGRCTNVKVRKADAALDIMRLAKQVIKKLKKVKVNCRQHHLSTTKDKYMMMFSHDVSTGMPYASILQFDKSDGDADDAMISLANFGSMLEAAIASQFQDVVDNIKVLEQHAGISRVGSAAHSIDVSINLVNAAHYDMGDAGYGVGLWLSESGKSHDNWYFLCPNSSIDQSDGVAIKLDHGIMIQWNGSELKHCTMDPGIVDESNTLIGTFLGPKDRFCRMQEGKRDFLIAKECDLYAHKTIVKG
jgi:hypothetical protein